MKLWLSFSRRSSEGRENRQKCLRARHKDGEGGSFSQLTFDEDGTAHALDHMLYDRKTQTGSAYFSGTGLIDAIKPLKDARQVLGGNPDTRIGNDDAHPPGDGASDFKFHFPGGSIELHGVIQEIDECLLKLHAIP